MKLQEDESNSTLEDVVRVFEKRVTQQNAVRSPAAIGVKDEIASSTTTASATSTTSVTKTALKKQTNTATASIALKKGVHFAAKESSIVGHVQTRDEISPRQKYYCWWRPKDFEGFRLAAKEIALSTRLEGRKAMLAVDEGYTKANYLACTWEEEEVHDNLQTHKILHHADSLRRWSDRQYTCRGLEHWTSKKHWEARVEVMGDAREIVVELSRYNETPQEIAKQYQDFSRSARILARFKGHADSEAAKQQTVNQDDCATAAAHMVY